MRRGKKYQRLKKNKCVEDWTDEYRPFLAPSLNYPYVGIFPLLEAGAGNDNRYSILHVPLQEYDVLCVDKPSNQKVKRICGGAFAW